MGGEECGVLKKQERRRKKEREREGKGLKKGTSIGVQRASVRSEGRPARKGPRAEAAIKAVIKPASTVGSGA